MKNINQTWELLIILFFCMAFTLPMTGLAQDREKIDLHPGMAFTEGKWKDIAQKAKENGKYIFVDAYTSWCGPCKLLKSKTFTEKHVASYFNHNFINYTVDMERGEGYELADRWDVTAYPTLLFFTPDGKIVLKQVGFVGGDKLIEYGKQAMKRN